MMTLITVMTVMMTLIMVGRRMLLSPTCPGPTLFTPATRNSYSIPFSSPEISWDVKIVKNTMMRLFLPCQKICMSPGDARLGQLSGCPSVCFGSGSCHTAPCTICFRNLGFH